MSQYATVDDLITLWRPLTAGEQTRAVALLDAVEASLALEADKVGIDLAKKAENSVYRTVLMSVVVDVVARALMTSTNQEPLSQFSQTAGPYTASGTYLVPGGGLFIKRTELARLGLRRQRMGVIDFYGTSDRNCDPSV